MNPVDASYVVSSLGWSLAGFAAGWVVGRLGRRVAEGQEAVVADDRVRGAWGHTLRTVAGLLILVLVAGTTVYMVRTADCQARLNAEFRAALAERSAAAAAEARAQRELLTAPPGTGRDAIQRYLVALDELERARQEHPLPVETGCG